MRLTDLLIVVGSVAVATMGGMAFGWVGAVVGFFLGGLPVGGLALIYEGIRRRRKWARLKRFFGQYYARDKRDEWERVKAELKPGQVVRARIVREEDRPTVFVDLGCGFPGSIFIHRVAGERKQLAGASRAARDPTAPEPGDELEARIIGFVDDDREIELAHRGCWLLLDGELIGFLTYQEYPIEGYRNLRPISYEAYAAFETLPKKEEARRCEVLSGNKTRRVTVKRGFRGSLSISLPEG